MPDPEIEALLRAGEIEKAAALARGRGRHRRAAELLALAGRTAEGVIVAMEAGEWRLALDLAFAGGDERVVVALCAELAKDASIASAAAAHARIARRLDAAARVLERSAPCEAGAVWYEMGEYAEAARCFDQGGDAARAMRAYEQHLAQTPDDADAAERLAELRAARGDTEGAVRALQASVRAGGGPSALRKLVDALVRLGHEGAARAALRRLRALDPQAPSEVSGCAGALPSAAGATERYAGRYRVVREVGSGATGRVLEAVDELTGESVALKVLSVGADRGGAFGRFMREADLARTLDDPTLVRMRALDPEGPTIVYDWMPGGTLAERIGAITVREARAVALRLLAALETLHRHGVVHRDIKPSNVLFDPAGQARLGDLGAAHLGDLGATVTGGLVGSLPYMAPEQITGAPVSAATDLYAFGCVLFQMLTGALPFAGPDFVTQHLSDPVPLPSRVRPALGTAYDAAIATLLAKNPLDRPQDVAAARALLATLPWEDPFENARPSERDASSIQVAVADEGARLVPASSEGLWFDTRLGREVELVRLPIVLRERVVRWAAASASDLQPVYELLEEGEELVAWVQPAVGECVHAEDLSREERARLEETLAAVEVDTGLAKGTTLYRSEWNGLLVPLRVLMGQASSAGTRRSDAHGRS